VPTFRNGVAAMRASTPPGIVRRSSASIGVSVGPGAITLTRMPSGPKSWAAVRVRPITACFVAWYAPMPELPRTPPMLLTFTIDPAPWRSITATSARRHSHVPFTFTAMIRSKSASGTWSSRPPPPMAALLNAPSSRPNRETVAETNSSTSDAEETSPVVYATS
jgi:hypothetical protein